MIVIFSGPTISHDEISRHLECQCLPPARRGDIYDVARQRPRAIGIIDGYFQGELSVWHKEILWAMSRGIHVFGASSMGALRAAELHQFGMHGVGRIFENYRDGIWEDDDEVALIHGPAEMGYVALSEPMSNIRATLEHAVSQGIATQKLADRLIDKAKHTFYHDRSWDNLLATSKKKKRTEQFNALTDWLVEGRIDIKHDDAVEMLLAIRDFVADNPPAKTVDYAFEHTHLWQGVIDDAETGLDISADQPNDPASIGVLNELRLTPVDYHNVQREALLRLLAIRRQYERGYRLQTSDLHDRLNEFRLQNGLTSRKSLDKWLKKNAMRNQDLTQLVSDHARIDDLMLAARDELTDQMMVILKESGLYNRLRKKAKAKSKHANKLQPADDDADNVGANRLQLAAWHFEDCLGTDMPADVDAYARSIGLNSAAEFIELLQIEYKFSHLKDDNRV